LPEEDWFAKRKINMTQRNTDSLSEELIQEFSAKSFTQHSLEIEFYVLLNQMSLRTTDLQLVLPTIHLPIQPVSLLLEDF